jgi:predicted PurR-regulated permease PerM
VLDRKTRLGPNAALLVVVVLLVMAVAALFWWRGNAIAKQTAQIADQEPRLSASGRKWRGPWGSIVAQQLRAVAESARTGLTGYVPGVASSVLGIGVALL